MALRSQVKPSELTFAVSGFCPHSAVNISPSSLGVNPNAVGWAAIRPQ